MWLWRQGGRRLAGLWMVMLASFYCAGAAVAEQPMSAEEFVVRLRAEELVEPAVKFCRKEQPENAKEVSEAFAAYRELLELAAHQVFSDPSFVATEPVSQAEWKLAKLLAGIFVKQKERVVEPEHCVRLLEMLRSRTVERLGKEVRKDYLNYQRFVKRPEVGSSE